VGRHKLPNSGIGPVRPFCLFDRYSCMVLRVCLITLSHRRQTSRVAEVQACIRNTSQPNAVASTGGEQSAPQRIHEIHFAAWRNPATDIQSRW
jgi:hypothetical protein